MRKLLVLMLVVTGMVSSFPVALAQSDAYNDRENSKLQTFLKHFDASVYMDAYFTTVLDDPSGDTSNLMNFTANCPFVDEFRLNVASVWLEYDSRDIRGKLLIQYGDIPNLRATPEEQFVKYMREAHFGFRVYQTLWVDLGYLPTPIGYESSYPVFNQISTVTTGGYFETGNFLGVNLSAQLTPAILAGVYVGNPYTLAYGRNKQIYGGLYLRYRYKEVFSVKYNNMIGNASIVTSELNHFYLYNNVILTVNPIHNLLLVGEIDYGLMGNSIKPPDTTKLATRISGFLQLTYRFTKWFAASLRGEYLSDPDGAITPLYSYDGKLRGLLTYGGTASVEFNPVPYSYFRAEYSYLAADKGNKVFSSMLADRRQALTFTAGLRVGTFR